MVKLSRRLLACYNWKDDFVNLAVNSEANTLSSYCEKDLFHIRTECIGFNVETWSKASMYHTIRLDSSVNKEIKSLTTGNSATVFYVQKCKDNKTKICELVNRAKKGTR